MLLGLCTTMTARVCVCMLLSLCIRSSRELFQAMHRRRCKSPELYTTLTCTYLKIPELSTTLAVHHINLHLPENPRAKHHISCAPH